MSSIDFDPADYIDDISTGELASELRDRFRKGEKIDKELFRLFENEDALDEALWRFKRGEYEDALLRLESALGKDWFGLSEILRRSDA